MKIKFKGRERDDIGIYSASTLSSSRESTYTLQWFPIVNLKVPLYFEKYCKSSYNHQSTILMKKNKGYYLDLNLYKT